MKPKYAFSIDDFCSAHDISRNHLYGLLREGRGPEIMKLGRRTLISLEAAERWREKMTAQSRKEVSDEKI